MAERKTPPVMVSKLALETATAYGQTWANNNFPKGASIMGK
jgi:hypothetical protein